MVQGGVEGARAPSRPLYVASGYATDKTMPSPTLL